MLNQKLHVVARHIRGLVSSEATRPSDGELLRAFCARNEQAAFSTLVKRHGPLVLSVCRRVLRHVDDAEDAFQATFLVLARQAGHVREKSSLAAWLHGVAYRISLNARRAGARRQKHEGQAKPMQARCPQWEAAWREVQLLVDEEILRLPARYREPFVLCCVENKSCAAAARELDLKEGTVWSRLSQARKRLRQRLARRGVALPAVAAVAALTPPAHAAIPDGLVNTTAKLASIACTGQTLSAAVVSPRVLAMAKGMARALLAAKTKLVMTWLVVAGIVAAAAGLGAYGGLSASRQDTAPPGAQQPPDHARATAKPAATPQAPTDLYGDPLPAGAVARLGTVRFRDFSGPAPQLAYARRGKVLISTGAQFFGVSAWDADSGRPLYRLATPRLGMSLAVSPDGNSLFCQGDLGIFWGIDSATGKVLRQFPGDWGQAAFSADGRIVAVAANQGWKMFRWDFATGKRLPELANDGEIGSAVAFSPDGKLMATAASDNTIRLWDTMGGKERRRLKGHDRLVCSLAFAPGGKILASTGEGSLIRLWDLNTGQTVRQVKGKEAYHARVVFSPDGKLLASWGGSGQLNRSSIQIGVLRLWDADTAQELRRWKNIQAFAFSPNGKVLATTSWDGVIRRWDTVTYEEIDPPQGHIGRLWSLRFGPDGRTLVSRGFDGQVAEWDQTTARVRRWLFGGPARSPETAHWRAEAVSADGKVVALLDWRFPPPEKPDHRIRLWDALVGKELPALNTGGMRRWQCALSPGGEFLAAAGNDGIRLWHVATGKELHHLQCSPGSFALSPDGTRLATTGESNDKQGGSAENSICLWDVANGKELRRWDSGQRWHRRLDFSPDGKRLVSAEVNSVRIWEMDSGKEILHLHGVGYHDEPAFSPSGRVLAMGGRRQWSEGDRFHESGTIRLWDSFSGEKIREFDVPQGRVAALAFAPDGRALASGGSDSTILLWNLSDAVRNVKRASLTTADLERLWSDLGGEAAKADSALWALALSPRQSLPFLQQRLRSSMPPDVKQIANLLADLDSKSFAARSKALQALQEMNENAEAPLRKLVEKTTSLEVRRRLELVWKTWNKTLLRRLRAVEALEQMEAPGSRQLLLAMARETNHPRVVEAANAALARLAKREQR
jgi:RNA polymerase sigma factor (sigma-70 family)